MFRAVVFIVLLVSRLSANDDSLLVKTGSKAPSFILNLAENSVQSFNMPYMKRVVLLNFWSSNVIKCRTYNKYLNRLAARYKNASYRNAESFEVISIAVQTDRKAWVEAIAADSLTEFTHGIAIRGYMDDVCKKYGVTSLPTEILIDENGTVLAVNPRIVEIENILDEKKNMQPIKKDVVGTLAQSSNRDEPVKFCQLFLFNFYGDSIQKTMTSSRGSFIFNDVKLNQDFILKIDNKVDINTTDPIALYTPRGEFLMDGRTRNNGFLFHIPARSSHKLTVTDTNSVTNYLGQIDVIKHLTFFTNGMGLTPDDEKDLNSIVSLLNKNKLLKVELTTHTDARTDKEYAMELTGKQAETIKSHLIKKGISEARIKTVAKGNSELRKICEGMIDCREEDHKLNRRVEFLLYKD